ncbi:annexin-2 receptor-like [Rhinolophus sinicus]|uniref:annexin-2 receptor-like n=1 Tax=Rhinolophus sinicus TaxID=89399 RepID=UPI003D7AC12C
MEQHFLDAVKKAWDSTSVEPGPLPVSIPSSEDSGPWPLSLYPVLGESSCHRGYYDGRLLSSPPWRLPSVYQRYRLLTGAQSTLEASPALPSPGLWPPATQMTPGTPAGETESEDGTTFQQLPEAQPPDAAVSSQDTETCDRAPASQRRRHPVAAWWSLRRVFSGCLQWIRRAVYTFMRLLSDSPWS